MYKIVWDRALLMSSTATMVKAFDEAINDGVDVLSISLASAAPFRPIDSITGDLELGSFHAVMKGIPVIAGASNTGPEAYTVANVFPWMLTVAATNIDRTFYADMTFGNNITIIVCEMFFQVFSPSGFTSLGNLLFSLKNCFRVKLNIQVRKYLLV